MRRSLTLRRSLAALALPLLLGGLAACGNDASEGSSSTSAEQPSAVDKADFVDDLQAGLEESTTAQMSMHMDMGGETLHADGEVDYTSTPPQLAMMMESPAVPDQSIEMRLVDKVLYMNMGRMTNGKFVSFDLNDADNLPPGMDQLTGTMDPLAAFESFGDAVQSVVLVGDEEIEGDELAHYKVRVDTSKIQQLQKLPTEAEMPKVVPYDIWLDDQNRVRKMTMDMDVQGSPVEVEIELFNWDEPVDIAAPPAGEIVDQQAFAG
jgi:hypothetical protein